LYGGYELWRLRLFSFGGDGLALVALALVLFGAYDSYPVRTTLILKVSFKFYPSLFAINYQFRPIYAHSMPGREKR